MAPMENQILLVEVALMQGQYQVVGHLEVDLEVDLEVVDLEVDLEVVESINIY
jgi:hypothetical protein